MTVSETIIESRNDKRFAHVGTDESGTDMAFGVPP